MDGSMDLHLFLFGTVYKHGWVTIVGVIYLLYLLYDLVGFN